jgi:hypothetical protein
MDMNRRVRSVVRSAAGLILLVSPACFLSCGPILGIVSPEAVTSRYLWFVNRSHGYLSFRATVPGFAPLVSPVLPPGGEYFRDLGELFGTLCPNEIVLEAFAFARAHPEQPALRDETVVPVPYASARIDLLPTRDFGCRADVDSITLDDPIGFSIWEVDEGEQAIGFEASWLAPERQSGLQAGEPPVAEPPALFPLSGRVVNLNGRPIPNVEVRLDDLGESVLTDADGRFEVMRPVGSYLVQAVIPGIEVEPTGQRFRHRVDTEVAIGFLAITETVPALSGPP